MFVNKDHLLIMASNILSPGQNGSVCFAMLPTLDPKSVFLIFNILVRYLSNKVAMIVLCVLYIKQGLEALKVE